MLSIAYETGTAELTMIMVMNGSWKWQKKLGILIPSDDIYWTR